MLEVGFFGLGKMGMPMATNLQRAGYRVVAYDIAKPDADEFIRMGGIIADDTDDVIEKAEVIFTMLAGADQVAQVWRDILFKIPKDKARKILLIDSSTIDVEVAKLLHDEASAVGFLTLDAPVSGGMSGAEAGTLTFMCGGDSDAFQQAEQILQFMGSNTFHCGTAGMGQATKLCNNMMLAQQMISVCEAFALADKLGLKAENLFNVSSVSSGQCWSLTTYCPSPGLVETAPSNFDYKAGFSAGLMLKDLILALKASEQAGFPSHFSKRAYNLYKEFVEEAGSDIDFSAIIKKFKEGNYA